MRLGLLGGTFDPIHLGHLLVAEQAREALRLDHVLLIPAGRPPHKPPAPVSPFSVRLRMVSLALGQTPGLLSSDLEGDEAHPSYTVDTLRRLQEQTGGVDEFWLLLGSDSLSDLPNWREPEEIQRLARIAVYPRPGAEEAAGATSNAPDVRRLDGPRLSLSSSEIRSRVREGRSIRFLVSDAVRAFILEQGLYRDPAGGAPASARGKGSGGPAGTVHS